MNHLVLVNQLVDRLDVRRGRTPKHLNQSAFSVGLDYLVNADLLLLDQATDVLLDVFTQLEQTSTCHSAQNAAVVDGSVSLELAISVLDYKEDIQNGHLLNEVVQKPEYIVKAVLFSLRHVGHQRSEVSRDGVLTVTKWPVLVHVV